ncbi:hypothetical protein JMJ35_003515 [Cladonia borealis]|uniref:Xylanolytic transcriptional activator regulatory domain-containing protein n=1 Tax=Cladonia borealis TaxID=184061 RepID=A0AA39V2S4_9LECA|nr:hypothetical protein JMJ35_003515 [Cladonia borealis]
MDVEQRALVLALLTALPTLRVLWSQGQAYPTHEDEEWEIVRILRKRQIGKSYEYKRPFFRRGKSIVGQPSGSIVTHNTGISFNVIREASCGQEKISLSYALQSIGMAVESGLHMDYSAPLGSTFSCGEREVRAATFWGCFALDQVWSLFIGRIPYLSRNAIRTPVPVIMNEVEAEEWIPYTDEGVSLDKDQGSLRNTGLVFQSLCELSTIINDTLYTLYTLYTLHTPGGVLSSQKILDAYTRYLN